jgi:beta-xylosidase
MREAPAPFKYKDRYYLITSACTGWNPNVADYAVADNILGPYESKGNPCVGTNAEKTFGTQSTFVLPVTGKPGSYVAMFDLWKPRQLSDSRHVVRSRFPGRERLWPLFAEGSNLKNSITSLREGCMPS